MRIHQATGGIAVTNAFLVADEFTGEAVLFDAPNDTVAPLLDAVDAAGYRLVGLWLTHGHFDHLADHAVVKSRFPDVQVLIHPLDADRLRHPGSAFFRLPFEIPPGEPDGFVEHAQRLRVGRHDVDVIHTPGHAPGHVMYHFAADGLLIGGDLIIGGAVGRTDLPDSDPAALADSVRRVMTLPDATRLLPGHGDPTTLGHERRTNPYVRAMLTAPGDEA